MNKLLDLCNDVIICIMTYIYSMNIGTYIQPDIEFLNKIELTYTKPTYKNYRHVTLIRLQKNMVNLSVVCKYFNNMVMRYGLKVLCFPRHINPDIVTKYGCTHLIARYDRKLRDEHLNQYKNLVYLNLHFSYRITDSSVSKLNNRKYLYLYRNKNVTKKCVNNSKNMVQLNLNSCDDRYNHISLCNLINLTHLYMRYDTTLTDGRLNQFSQLRVVVLTRNNKITDNGIADLDKLTHLYMANNTLITNEGIKNKTKLICLDLSHNPNITDDGLENLVNMMCLYLNRIGFYYFRNNGTPKKITNRAIKKMTKLVKFKHYNNTEITDSGIEHLLNLEQLVLNQNNKITNVGLKYLTKLTHLTLGNHSPVSQIGINHLTNLFECNIR